MAVTRRHAGKQSLSLALVLAIFYLPVKATCPSRAGAAPSHQCPGLHSVASQARRVCSAWAGKGCMNLMNYRICFCHCSASHVKFTVRGAHDDVCIINNCKARMSWCCTSEAMIRKSRARLWCSPGVICRGAGGVAPAQGLTAGAVPGFYF